MSTPRYSATCIVAFGTGDFGVAGLNNPHFGLTNRVTIHRTEVQPCRTPDRASIPPGTLSQLELVELPEVQKHQGIKTKWVIVHWLVHPDTHEKISSVPWEAIYYDANTTHAKKSDYLKAWESKAREFKRHGCLTLAQYKERIRVQASKAKTAAPRPRAQTCREADLLSARLKVLERQLPATVEAIRAGNDTAATQFLHHESQLPPREIELADYLIVKAYATSPTPPTAEALSNYVFEQTGKRYSPGAIKKRRERLGLVGGKTGPAPRVSRPD